MATNKSPGGPQNLLNQISVEQCFNMLSQMQEQMKTMLPYVPKHLTPDLKIPDLKTKPLLKPPKPPEEVIITIPEDSKIKGYTKVVAAKKNADGTVTRMYALRKDILKTDSDSGSCSNKVKKKKKKVVLEYDPILVDSQQFLENFKSGVYQREFNKLNSEPLIVDSQEFLENFKNGLLHRPKPEIPPPSKPIHFIKEDEFLQQHGVVAEIDDCQPVKCTLAKPESCEEPNILKGNDHKSINIFKTKEEAERFMMFTIKEIIQLFSQIANAFKSDAVKHVNYSQTDITQKAYVAGCCIRTIKELQVLVNGPVKNLRNELTQKFITVLPQLSYVFENVKRLDDLNSIANCSLAKTLDVDVDVTSCKKHERASGDGC